jgi:hypothetical protein
MVGRQHCHHVIGRPVDGQRRQRDGSRGVPAHRFAQQLVRFQPGRLLADQWQVAFSGDNVNVFRFDQRRDPRKRCLKEALAAQQRQEGLWSGLAGQRPEACATAAGKDYGIHHRPTF